MDQHAFEIISLSPMYHKVKPTFARAKVEIPVLNKKLNANCVVTLDLALTYNDVDTVQSVHQKIVDETILVLREALSQCDGCSLSELKVKMISGADLSPPD